MKRNLLSILILVLLIVNIALTAVMMFSVTGTNSKVSALVTDISTVMNLELTNPGGEADTSADSISIADTDVYSISSSMTMALKPETAEDGSTTQKYLVCNISFSQNTLDEDYATYGGSDNMTANEELIKDAITSVVSTYTSADIQADTGYENLKADILAAVQDMFQSDFIYKVSISEVKIG